MARKQRFLVCSPSVNMARNQRFLVCSPSGDMAWKQCFLVCPPSVNMAGRQCYQSFLGCNELTTICTLQKYKAKLEKVALVRKELRAHLDNLPDLSLLPDVTGGLAPLPSAGDLFAR